MMIRKEKIEEIHSIQLEMLKSVITVCETLSIPFFLVHGTLLGAAKFGGFVPYDDDIDIAMMRKDYERFLTCANDLLPPNLFCQSHWSESRYPLSFAKIRNSNTTCLTQKLKGINQGIYIDVFPIDYWQRPHFFKRALLKIANVRIGSVFYDNPPIKIKVRRLISKILIPSFKTAVNLRERIVSTQRKTDLISITGGKKTDTGIPFSWFNEGTNVVFCGLVCRAPTDYISYLNHIYYGNYETATLLEQRNHDKMFVEMDVDIIDTEKPYWVYQN